MLEIGSALVERLIADQFPQFASLPVRPVDRSGWDNRCFRIGSEHLVRLPTAPAYAGQVAREQKWLPKLAPRLPIPIPAPVARGEPGHGYPFPWSIYRWLPGEDAAVAEDVDRVEIAVELAAFLVALQRIDANGGPEHGAENFHRGGSLMVYDAQAREAIQRLGPRWNTAEFLSIWERSAATAWRGAPVWVHGDVAPGNLLIDGGKLTAVIDFGLMCVGDPACDFAIAWRFFDERERGSFRNWLEPDDGAWSRGRCWALWKAAILASGMARSNPVEMAMASRTLDRILEGC